MNNLKMLNEGFNKRYLVESEEIEKETDEIEVGDLFTNGDETYKLLDVQIDEDGNVVVEAENQETSEPEEINYISEEEAKEFYSNEESRNEENFSECVDTDKLREKLNSLNEAEMSDEDRADSELLRSIYNKSVKRSNAKLTPEEKKVLDKYGLKRDDNAKIVPNTPGSWGNAIVRSEDDDSEGRSRYYGRRYHSQGPSGMSNDKINLADRARKYVSGQRSPNTYGHQGGVNALERDRELQNAEMQGNYNQMKNDLWSRNYHKNNLGNIDSTADDEIKKLQDRIAEIQRRKETDRSYHAGQLDRYQGRINKALRKEESLLREAVQSKIQLRANKIANDLMDFQEELGSYLDDPMSKWNEFFDEATIDTMDSCVDILRSFATFGI